MHLYINNLCRLRKKCNSLVDYHTCACAVQYIASI